MLFAHLEKCVLSFPILEICVTLSAKSRPVWGMWIIDIAENLKVALRVSLFESTLADFQRKTHLTWKAKSSLGIGCLETGRTGGSLVPSVTVS